MRCLPPMAWTVFAQRHPDDALLRPGQIGPASDLVNINAKVNGIEPRQGEVPTLRDEWLIWPDKAWCHDYAITKRHELLIRGWPSSALLLAECRTETMEPHMVLIANGQVMDNRRAAFVTPKDSGYDWSLPMQQADDPNHWERQ